MYREINKRKVGAIAESGNVLVLPAFLGGVTTLSMERWEANIAISESLLLSHLSAAMPLSILIANRCIEGHKRIFVTGLDLILGFARAWGDGRDF